MAENTPNRGYTYPEYTDPADFPAQMQELATDIDADVENLIDASLDGRERPGVRIFSNTAQAYAANTTVVAGFDLTSHNPNAMFNAANNSIIFNDEGLYVIGYDIANVDSSADSHYSSWLHLVSTGEVGSGFTNRGGSGSNSPHFAEMVIRYMHPGDELQVRFRGSAAGTASTHRAYAAQISQNTAI
jgi:hypothetical protein